MKNLKSSNIFYLIVISILFVGCSKNDLNLNPISSIGDSGFYNTDTEIEGAVIAIYDGLQEIPKSEFALTEMRSDNTKSKIGQGDIGEFEEYRILPTNFYISKYWKDNYNVIFRANRVLKNLNVVSNDIKKSQFEGEARFSRALAHFNLVNAFGDVPILDKEVNFTDPDFSDYLDRDTVNNVLSFIVLDLTEAISLLPPRGEIEDGRATSGAASALLAKVYLTQKNYQGAQALLETLIGDSKYDLVEDYEDVFYSEQNKEIIFAIGYKDNDASEGQDFSFEMTLQGGTAYNFLEENFREDVDILDVERAAVLFNPNDQFTIGKYLPTSSNIRLAGNDWIVLRLADVYLMHAEAIMAGANFTTNINALNSYNTIRFRVGLSTLSLDGSGVLTKEMLLHERRIELAFENHRFNDLVRFGKAIEILTAHANSKGDVFEVTDLLNPIPQNEINISRGLLLQNTGY